ncbi:outer membrane protein assembly factor BamA, partial [bacterium]
KVIVTLSERPIIEKITFSGIERLLVKEEKIKEALKSKETQYLDYPNLTEDIHIIGKMYEKIGYSQVKIDYQVEANNQTNKAKVQFNIVEGKRIKIKDVKIAGNKSFPGIRIIKLMKTRKGWFFNAGVLKDEVIREDLERIKSFYRREGFADVEVDYEVASDAKRPWLYITVNIREGKKYLVGNVSIKGNKDIPEKEILPALKECVPGKVFSDEAMKQDIANVQGLYFDRGYIMAQVQETTSLNTYTGRTDIVYSITENEVAYVDKIKIRGNIKTKDIVIRRELRILPGDKFDGNKLRRTKERLQNMAFFEEVSYDTEETGVANKKDLVVEVKEAKTGAFSFGGGYSTVEQFVGFVQIEQNNFDWRNFPYFTGGGQDLKFRASFGTLTSGFEFSFTEPWAFDYPVALGFDAYRREHKREEDVGYGYDEKVTGGDVRLGKEITEYVRADLSYRLDQIRISNVDDAASDDLKRESGTNNVSSMELDLAYDDRDNRLEPHRGNLLTAGMQGAGGPLGGDKDFWKFFGRASHYFPLFRGSTLEIRGRVGLANYYGKSDSIPIYERFFAGGASTVRGYEERKLGPVDPVTYDPLGGNSLFVGNIEYIYPLFNFLKLAAFVDTGNVWGRLKDVDLSDLKTGIGVGVRIKTPVGPIMVDYGIPLNKEPGETRRKAGRFHFSMSHGF